METKDVILRLREERGLTQSALAQEVFVTRQAVSRWETGETLPETQTLKLLSRLFDVSINTLLGSPRQLVCQCCGMPLDKPEDAGTEADGTLSGDYCHYCYQNGAFTDPNAAMEAMIALNLQFNAENGYPFGTQEEAERMMRSWMPTLKRWRNAGAE